MTRTKQSFVDIMSEEFVANETEERKKEESKELEINVNDSHEVNATETDAQGRGGNDSSHHASINLEEFLTDQEKADRDFAIALAAQLEEEDRLQRREPKCGNSKVNVCHSLDEHYNYGNGESVVLANSSENDAAEELGAKLLAGSSQRGVCFKNGIATTSDGTKVSKHDALINGMTNSVSVGELDGAGDMAGLMITNSVSNSLRSFSQKKKQKGVYVGGGRVSAKDSRSTSEAVLDESTRLLLFKLIQKGLFDEVNGVFKTGKESNIYHAVKNNPGASSEISVEDIQNESHSILSESNDEAGSVASSTTHFEFENSDDCRNFAVKVFKTTLNEFSKRISYIKGDHRFAHEKHAKSTSNKRKFIAQWVEKEFRNLCRAHAKGLNVPRPILFKDNVLVLEMIMESSNSEKYDEKEFLNSPQLKEVTFLSTEKWNDCYAQTMGLVFDLFLKCRLVHADLSEYNLLLNDNDRVFVLDFGQAIDTSHPDHQAYLLRDIEVVNSFFEKKGVVVHAAEEVVQDIVRTSRALKGGVAI